MLIAQQMCHLSEATLEQIGKKKLLFKLTGNVFGVGEK